MYKRQVAELCLLKHLIGKWNSTIFHDVCHRLHTAALRAFLFLILGLQCFHADGWVVPDKGPLNGCVCSTPTVPRHLQIVVYIVIVAIAQLYVCSFSVIGSTAPTAAASTAGES